jgi:hypothetical protein
MIEHGNATEVQDSSSKPENDGEGYFKTEGFSSKIDALMEDLQQKSSGVKR